MYVNKYIKILLFKIFLINNSTINKYIIINIYRAALFGPRVPNRHLVRSVQSPPRRTSPRAVHMEPVPTPPPYPEPKRLLSPRSLRPRFAAAVRGLRLSGFTGNTRTFFFMRTWFSTRFIPTLVLHARLIP